VRSAGTDDEVIFREVQRFLWWVLLPVGIVTGIIWWTFARQILLGQPVGEQPVPDWLAWVLTLVFGLGLPALALAMRLVTEVRPGSVSVRLIPFRLQPIPLAYVKEASVRRYSAAREYGGYGVRKGFLGLNLGRGARNGWAYTARGDQGVQLVMTNGFRVLIGSQQPERLLSALRSAGADLGPKKTTRKKRTPASGERAKVASGARAKKAAAGRTQPNPTEQAQETVAEPKPADPGESQDP